MLYDFDYGNGKLHLALDPGKVRAILAPAQVTRLADVDVAVRRSLENPLWSPPLGEVLKEARSALIVTVDNTRPSPSGMILPILDTCDAAGARATVCIATGRHRQMARQEIESHLGKEILSRAPVLQHDAHERRLFRHLGTTRRGTEILVNDIVFRHDVVIGVGIIEPSYLAGWSGGRKLIMPGLAYAESIDNNHFYLNRPGARIGRLHGNPLSDDAEEFARKVPFHFITYTISGPNDEAVEIVSGDPFKAHEEACRRAEGIYRVKKVCAPVVISSAGGWPYDCDLVQGKKAIIPAAEVVEPGGVVILLAECPDGPGTEETFLRWLLSKTPRQALQDASRRELFSLGAHGASILARPIVRKDASVLLVTNPKLRRQLNGSYVQTPASLEEAWEMARQKCPPAPEVVICKKARRLICE